MIRRPHNPREPSQNGHTKKDVATMTKYTHTPTHKLASIGSDPLVRKRNGRAPLSGWVHANMKWVAKLTDACKNAHDIAATHKRCCCTPVLAEQREG